MAVAAVKSSTSLDLFHINLAKDCLQSLPVEDSCGGGHAADAELRGEDDGTSPAEAAPRRRSLNAFSSSLKDFEQGPIIGVGAVGRVRRVTYRLTGQHYALKCMSIAEVQQRKQKVHTKQEKDILLEITHPFIVDLKGTFSDYNNVYLLLSYIPGGELLRHLTKAPGQCFPTDTARFYTASIVLALEYLHDRKIVYRDLKPENLLLDKDGYLKLCDFGLAKRLQSERTKTNCGTSEYVAPEVLEQRGHGMAVDWWSLGILLYEMLVGRSPFYHPNGPSFTYRRILSGKYDFPPNMDIWAQDLIRRLLKKESERLGAQGAAAVKNHPFFTGIVWEDLLSRKMEAPLKPTLSHDGDTSNFEDYRDQIKVGRADVSASDAWWTEGTSGVTDSTAIDLEKEFQGF